MTGPRAALAMPAAADGGTPARSAGSAGPQGV